MNGERQIIRPEVGVPVMVTLDFDEPLETESQFGPQWRYQVNGNTGLLYLPEAAKLAIERAGAAKGNTISLTKTKSGNRNLWKAEIARQEPARSQATARPSSAPPPAREQYAERPTQTAKEESRIKNAARPNDAPSQSWPLAEQLLPFLRAAIIACSQAQKEAQQNGAAQLAEFGTKDVCSLAITLYIQHAKGGR